MATRISELTPVDPKTIDDKSKILFASADTQIASPGTSFGVDGEAMQYIVNNETITSTAHGLVAQDEGKPLYGIAVVDDTVAAEYGMWLVLEYIDADNFKIVPPGVAMDIPVAKIEDGNAYDVTVKGYELYWDESAVGGLGQYVATQPVDSQHPHAIHVVSVGATTFRAKLIERQLDWSLDQNGVMINPANYISGGAAIGHVVATGVGATDSAALAAAITAGYDVIYIDDNAAALELDSGVDHAMGTIQLQGYTAQRARVNLSGGTRLVWGNYGNMGAKLIEAVGTNGWEDCAVADDGGTITATEVLDIGDMILVAADNALVGAAPHFTGGTQRPLEIARITQIEDGSVADETARLALTGVLVGERFFQVDNSTVYNYDGGGESTPGNWSTPGGDYKYVLERRLEDTYSTNVRYFLYVDGSGDPDLNLGGGMTNLDFTGSSNPAGTTSGFLIYHDHFWECRNVWWQNTGQLTIFGSYGSRLYDCRCLGQVDPGAIYGFSYAGVTDLQVYNYTAQKCRHFATSGGWNNGLHRWASNTGVKFIRCTGYQTGVEGGSVVGWDTHSDGLGIEYDHCDVVLGGDNLLTSSSEYILYAFQSRSRGTRYRDCRVKGSATNKHIGWRSDSCVDTEYIRCEMRGGTLAVWARSLQAGYPCHRTIIRDCDFDDMARNAIILDGGIDSLIEYTKVTNSGGGTAGINGATLSAITLTEYEGEDVGAVIRNCYLPKGSGNTASIRYPDTLTISEVQFWDNRTSGYATDLGLDAALANTAALLVEYDGRNNHNTEGTSIKSTGETLGTKFLREDGDGTCSWQPASASAATGYDLATDWAAGDDATDDTADLRTAIGNSDLALYLPFATYLTSGTLVIPPDKVVFGPGIIHATQTDGEPAIDIGRQGDYTVTTGTDRVNSTGHLLQEGWPVKFYAWVSYPPAVAGTTPGGITSGTTYYVRNPTANDFQISATPTGSIIDITTSGTGPIFRFWMNASHSRLSGVKVEGDASNQDAIGIRTGASSRFSIEDVRVNLFNEGVELGYAATDIPPWGSWLVDVRNLFITNCSLYGLNATTVNGSRANVTIENSTGVTTGKYFGLTTCAGSHFNIHAEGEFQTVTSTIDDCNALVIDGSWLEYAAGANASRTVPFLTVGGVTQCTNLSANGISLYGGTDLETGILLDRVDGMGISGSLNVSAFGNEMRYTANAFNINDRTVGSASQGLWQHRYGAPVELSQLPVTNYFPDPFFDRGEPYIATADQVNIDSLTEETTIVLPGRYRSVKATGVASNNSARVIFRLPLSGRSSELKGRKVTVGVWIYAPSTYYDIDANPNRFPFVRVVTDGTTPSNSQSYNASQHIPDNWTLSCHETAETGSTSPSIIVPTDATYIRADIYLQNTDTPQIASGQHIFIGGFVVVPGTQEVMERIKHGGFQNVEEKKSNMFATTTPTTLDDQRERYSLGSEWFNTTTDHFFLLTDPVNGLWKQVTA